MEKSNQFIKLKEILSIKKKKQSYHCGAVCDSFHRETSHAILFHPGISTQGPAGPQTSLGLCCLPLSLQNESLNGPLHHIKAEKNSTTLQAVKVTYQKKKELKPDWSDCT